MMHAENAEPKEKVDKTLLITILPGVLYLSSYLYYWSIFATYRIPTTFISISLNSVLILGGIIFVIGVIMISLSYFVTSALEISFKRQINFKLTLLASVILTWGFITFFILIADIFISLSLWWIALITFLLCIIFIATAIVISSKLDTQQPRKLFTTELFVKNLYRDSGFLALFIYLIIPYSTWMWGASISNRKTHFYTIPSKEKILVLAKSDSYFLCRKYDERKNVISDSLIIIKLPESGSLTLGTYEKQIDFTKLK